MLTNMSKRGFTLIETVMFIALSSALMAVLSGLLVFFYRTNASIIEQTGAITSARRGIETAMRDLREATYAETGAYPIESISENKIVFYADTDADDVVEKITYNLIDSVFYKHVVDPTGNPFEYTDAGATSTISTEVRNTQFSRDVFTYFNAQGEQVAATSTPLDVTFINASIVVNVNPDRAPNEFTLTSSATLRNLRPN